MAIPVGPNDIWSFLAPFIARQEAREGDHISAFTPSWNPAIYNDPLNANVGGDASSSPRSSRYQTTSYACSIPSTARRSSDSSNCSSHAWSRPQHSDRASSVGQSTAPSDRPLFQQQFAIPDPNAHNANPADNYVLWCEFRDLLGCDVTFRGDDESPWIEHHLQHLNHKPPARLSCWFCDDTHFAVSDYNGFDAGVNYEQRMQHVKGHIDFDYATPNMQRPDFRMIEYLYRRLKVLDKQTYELAIQYTELPPSLQLPEDDSGHYRDVVPKRQEDRYVEYVYHDLQKEAREQRREATKKHQSSSVSEPWAASVSEPWAASVSKQWEARHFDPIAPVKSSFMRQLDMQEFSDFDSERSPTWTEGASVFDESVSGSGHISSRPSSVSHVRTSHRRETTKGLPALFDVDDSDPFDDPDDPGHPDDPRNPDTPGDSNDPECDSVSGVSKSVKSSSGLEYRRRYGVPLIVSHRAGGVDLYESDGHKSHFRVSAARPRGEDNGHDPFRTRGPDWVISSDPPRSRFPRHKTQPRSRSASGSPVASVSPAPTSPTPVMSQDSMDSELYSLSDDSESISSLAPDEPTRGILVGIADRLVRDFYFRRTYLPREVPQGSNAAGRGYSHGSSGHASSSGQGSGASGPPKRKNMYDGKGKGKATEDDEEEDQQNRDKRARITEPDTGTGPTLACPFWKDGPYGKHRSCYKFTLRRIRDVKQHLARKHTPTLYCQTCFEIYDNEDLLFAHVDLRRCQRVPGRRLDGIDPHTDRVLRRRANPAHSIEEQWFTLWDVLFPGKRRPFSPYIDESLSTDLRNFSEYFQNHSDDALDEMIPLLRESNGETRQSEEEIRARLRRILILGMNRIFEDFTLTQARPPFASPLLVPVSLPPSIDELASDTMVLSNETMGPLHTEHEEQLDHVIRDDRHHVLARYASHPLETMTPLDQDIPGDSETNSGDNDSVPGGATPPDEEDTNIFSAPEEWTMGLGMVANCSPRLPDISTWDGGFNLPPGLARGLHEGNMVLLETAVAETHFGGFINSEGEFQDQLFDGDGFGNFNLPM
ncbi:hypothetical protein QBC39DRAFT_122608 [Podospora conica]|nr:hypothetical protein QBC39DRAFT_122608 [Schizothecium conicum]